MLKHLKKAQEMVCHLLITIMVLSLFLQIIAREFNLEADWTEEISRFAFISLVFIAASYTSLNQQHLRISIVSDILMRRLGQQFVFRVQSFVSLTFDVLMVVFCYENFLEGLDYPNTSPALGFNLGLLFLAPTVGFLLSAIVHLMEVSGTSPYQEAEEL
ncbi:2,3-diketo-L-gulonate TRAP transporter small permease protein YiaM [Grimontia marina]|uniref:TRAP transporter small permease protein n=1 Tax=Grimontia marina TaxID=646534 RepID=A0A128F9M5_9GAMM|nr:2,3-diketo-L-gulonate TRAP transporter small permease protein YiaM [Grimontia marina]